MERFPNQVWLEAVGAAIGCSGTIVEMLIESWITLGKTSKDMQERLIILAQHNGKTLYFSDPDHLS